MTEEEELAFLIAHPMCGAGGIIEAAVAIAATVGSAVGAGAVVGGAMIATGVGMTMSVVGAVTKNKTLSQIGMGFSAAGALTGLGAAAGVFDGAEAAAQETLGQSIVASTQGEVGNAGALAPGDVAYAPGAIEPTTGNVVPGPPTYTGQVGATPGLDQGMAGGIGAEANTPAEAGTMPAQPMTVSSQPGTVSSQEGASSLLNDSATSPTPSAPQAPSTPDPFGVNPKPSAGPNSGFGPNSGSNPAGEFTGSLTDPTGTATPQAVDKVKQIIQGMPQNASEDPSWWQKLDPTSKAAVMLVAGQTAAGGVGGLFTGMQAQRQLALQQLIDQENRNQFNLMFARETSSPGLIQYGPTTGKATT